jgi:PAS domain S-box-containing protein
MILEQIKIEEQRTLLDKIFSSSPDLIWYMDAKGRYITVNHRFASIIAKSPSEFVGKTAQEMLPADIAEPAKKYDAEAAASMIPLYTEEKVRFADGHEEMLDSVRTPIFDANGEYIGLLGFERDVTVRVIMENKLRNTQIELEQAVSDANAANEHKGEFLARMSHEIRTPMNAIIGITNIVQRKLNDIRDAGASITEVKDRVEQIETSSQHLLGLLNDILDISKIEAGKIDISEETVELSKLANTVVGIIKPRCDDKNISFETHFDTFTPSTFLTDSLRLRQVLINLLGNAVKFTSELGRVEFRIEKKDRHDGKTLVEFSVRDTGIGISGENLAKLFRPFEQGSGQITKKFGGTGLGLAISRRIVQLLGGDITVNSKEGEGSIFSFSIWIKEAGALPDDVITSDTTDKFIGKKALLVDDVAINRMIVISLLEETGMEIDEAVDGVTALKQFKDSPDGAYDLILMDIQMPNMNGYEAATAIRALNRKDAATVPIVALTANAFKDDIDRALKHGMNAHLSKPIEMEKLIEILFRFMPPKQ